MPVAGVCSPTRRCQPKRPPPAPATAPGPAPVTSPRHHLHRSPQRRRHLGEQALSRRRIRNSEACASGELPGQRGPDARARAGDDHHRPAGLPDSFLELNGPLSRSPRVPKPFPPPLDGRWLRCQASISARSGGALGRGEREAESSRCRSHLEDLRLQRLPELEVPLEGRCPARPGLARGDEPPSAGEHQEHRRTARCGPPFPRPPGPPGAWCDLLLRRGSRARAPTPVPRWTRTFPPGRPRPPAGGRSASRRVHLLHGDLDRLADLEHVRGGRMRRSDIAEMWIMPVHSCSARTNAPKGWSRTTLPGAGLLP
jgi:hypothetical protein